MGMISGLRRFLRAFREAGSVPSARRHRGHSVAKAVKDSTQIGATGYGFGRAGTEAQHEIATRGHEAYGRSLEKND